MIDDCNIPVSNLLRVASESQIRAALNQSVSEYRQINQSHEIIATYSRPPRNYRLTDIYVNQDMYNTLIQLLT